MKKRLLSILLCLCMAMTLLPTTAFAAEIQAGAPELTINSTTQTVCFGGYEWYVIGNASGGVKAPSGHVTLLSKSTVKSYVPFREGSNSDPGGYTYHSDSGYYYANNPEEPNWTNPSDYMGSTLQQEMADFAGNLGAEGSLVTARAALDNIGGQDCTNQKAWPLSYAEYDTVSNSTVLSSSASWWWLRSPGNAINAYCVNEDGYIFYHVVDYGGPAVRPALYLNLSSVLFTSSAAAGGKSDATVGSGFVGATAPTGAVKFTMRDDGRQFNAATTAVNGSTLTLSYTGATVYDANTAPNEYISAIIKNSSGAVTHYAKLAQPTSASGTVTLTLPDGFDPSADKVYVFSEQCNGNTNTDFASALQPVSTSQNAYSVTNHLTNITSDNPATYHLMHPIASYTATLSAAANFALPASITVKVGGNELTSGYTYDSTNGDLEITSVTGNIEIIAEGVAPTYIITADPATLTFGSEYTGYSQPATQTVTIENTGNQSVTVDLPALTNYEIAAKTGFGTSTNKAVLAANGDKATFTVAPVTGLSAGTYNGTITVNGTNSASTTVGVSFTVQSQGGGGDTTDYYTLTFDTNGGSSISSITRAEYTTIDLTLDRYIPTREGWEFTGWYSDEGLTDKITSIRLTKNITIYAGWEDKTNPNTGFENPFTDVSEDNWFFDDVMFVFQKGLMIGVSDTLFDPYGTTTRAMAATTIWRMEGSPAPENGNNPFTDVAGGQWYTDAILWANENGIAEGYGGGLFGTNDPVTREQLAAFFYKYAAYKGYDTEITGSLSRFTDKDDISEWAVEAMEWAVGYGLIEGKDNNILDPQGNATRAEFAAMLHRFIEKNELEEGITATGLMGWIDPKRTLNIPNTSDSTSTTLWTSLMLFSLAAFAVLTLLLKRRREEEADGGQLVNP